MKQLETLLNILIQRGWKPWGIEGVDKIFCAYSKPMLVGYDNTGKPIGPLNPRSLRELVSIESGLWQFVVENKLYAKTNTIHEKHFGIGQYKNFYDVHYQYRLLESALIPEEELGKFLVDNITINESA